MKCRRITLRSLAAALAVLLMTISIAPAFAAEEQTIVAGVTVGGVDVSGLTAAQAEATITANVLVPSGTVAAVTAGKAFSLSLTDACSVRTADLVAAAISSAGPGDIAPLYIIHPVVVGAFVTRINTGVRTAPVNAVRKIVKRRLRLTASKAGRSVSRAAALKVVNDALVTALATVPAPGVAIQVTVTVPLTVLAPKVTAKNIGKTIIVSLREYKVLLYNGARFEKAYRCAIGMRSNPTPRGTFKVIAKSARPTWRNPGSAWAKGMPKVIRPGYYNPLGLRALYINASGIRIHGTAKTSSMGHAASHGCIRLTNKNVVDIYPRVKVGTPVYILR